MNDDDDDSFIHNGITTAENIEKKNEPYFLQVMKIKKPDLIED